MVLLQVPWGQRFLMSEAPLKNRDMGVVRDLYQDRYVDRPIKCFCGQGVTFEWSWDTHDPRFWLAGAVIQGYLAHEKQLPLP